MNYDTSPVAKLEIMSEKSSNAHLPVCVMQSVLGGFFFLSETDGLLFKAQIFFLALLTLELTFSLAV